jgi:hypothetical protein
VIKIFFWQTIYIYFGVTIAVILFFLILKEIIGGKKMIKGFYIEKAMNGWLLNIYVHKEETKTYTFITLIATLKFINDYMRPKEPMLKKIFKKKSPPKHLEAIENIPEPINGDTTYFLEE